MSTPISIITGYLGAGKTTLLRHILQITDKKIAILMNEFGDVAIDSKIVNGKNIKIAELAGGCVCCSLTGEFEAAAEEIVEKYSPELIIVETTGLAEPDSLIDLIEADLPDLKLDSVITVADADALLHFPSIGHTGVVQLEIADVIVLNKIDLARGHIEDVVDKIRRVNKDSPIYQTVRCKIDVDLLFGFHIEKLLKHKGGWDGHLHESAIVYESDKKFNKLKFESFLSKLPNNVIRAKGFITFDKSSQLFNYVFGRYDFENFQSDKTQIVFIGEDLLELKDKIFGDLEKCQIIPK